MNLKILFLFLLITSCTNSTGFKSEPNKTNNPKKIGLEQRGVTLKFHDLNKMNTASLPKFDDIKIKENKKLNKLVEENKYYYSIGPGDVINISITDIDDINGSYTISPNGDVTIPYVGQVVVNNKTKEEAQAFINDVLKTYYQEPETIVKIEQYNSAYVYITGAINRPLSILLSEQPLKIIDALIRAGYIKDQKSYVKTALLRRDNEVYEIDLYELLNKNNTELDIFLRKDDVLHVSESDTDQAYAFGEFTTSGPISVYKDLNLTELLATKGINKATAKTKNIYVLREDRTKFLHIDIFVINLNNPAAFITANNFYILPNDIVFIPSTKLVKWNNVISLLTPSETLFKTYKPYIAEQDDWYIISDNENIISDNR
ncbi:polysaccharide biosynthesis/export family protein [Candidatus Pelagibacter sp.]|nr:polysaccharide biosynthesis/export family protein [Candidatus Pelagibacter sp.]